MVLVLQLSVKHSDHSSVLNALNYCFNLAVFFLSSACISLVPSCYLLPPSHQASKVQALFYLTAGLKLFLRVTIGYVVRKVTALH